jgi:DNA polymerase-3 subunit gamma/tau
VPQTVGVHVGPALSTSPVLSLSYQVLALKYRPSTFDEVVGQTTVTRTLRNAIEQDRIGHAFLLSGARGVGKTTTARILAKALNCSKGEGPTAEPCGQCDSCREIADGNALDVQEIDGASNNSVDQVRELRESARYNPARDRFKIWIIDEVHMLSTGAFNALLKTLEEPPPRVKFIFATTEYHKIPETILSRCQQYDFRMIPARELQAHLRTVAEREGITIGDAGLAQIARAAEGSVRDALSLFDQVLAFTGNEVKDEEVAGLLGLVDRELLHRASGAIQTGDSLAVFDLVESLADYGADYRNFVRELLLHLREILLVKLAPEGSALVSAILPEERERLRERAEAFSEEDLLRGLDVLTRTEGELRVTPDPRVTLELALLKLVQLRRLLPFTELVAKVERLAGGSVPALPPSRSTRAPAAPARKAAAAAPPASPPASPRAVPEEAPPPASPRAVPEEAPPPASPRAVPEEAPPPVPDASDPAGAILVKMLELCETRPSLAQPLRRTEARLDGASLVLRVPADFATFATMHSDEYRDLAKKAAGRTLTVLIEAGAPPAEEAEAEPTEEELKQRRLREEAEKEPAVQEALDLFDGRVVDVKEAKASREDA